MFEIIAGIESLQVGLEARSPEQEQKRRAFLQSRIDRRWNFNKNSPSNAQGQLTKYKATFAKIKKRTEGKTFDKDALASLKLNTRAIAAKSLEAGLKDITGLAAAFAKIAEMPPSTEQGNLPHFKAAMVKAIKDAAPSYGYSGYKVYAGFMVNKSLVQTGASAKSLGYDDDFIAVVETSLDAAETLIKEMIGHIELIRRLGTAIVDAMMGPKAADYLHARRGFELVCTMFTSILTQAWEQYMVMALSVADKIATCYK